MGDCEAAFFLFSDEQGILEKSAGTLKQEDYCDII